MLSLRRPAAWCWLLVLLAGPWTACRPDRAASPEELPHTLLADAAPAAVPPSPYAVLERLVRLPRHAGAPQRERTVELLADALRPWVDTVELQRFAGREGRSGRRRQLVNVVARQRPHAPRRLLLATHWDTRPWADRDPYPWRRDEPIPGANDGGSGVAVLLALAARTRSLDAIGIDYVLFDGEELGWEGDDQAYCQGSRHFAGQSRRLYPKALPEAVVIDMVGDSDQQIFKERSSLLAAPRLVAELWDVAREQRASSWRKTSKYRIIDDQTELQKAGFPAILVIDFDYPHWHTQRDTLDKVSAASLDRTLQVLLAFVSRREAAGAAR